MGVRSLIEPPSIPPVRARLSGAVSTGVVPCAIPVDHELLMRLSVFALGFAAVSALPGALPAQATADRARLMFSIGVGQLSGGGTLWSVDRQPLIDLAGTDSMSLSRHFRRNLVISMSGTYFPGRSLGFNVEAQLLGLGTEDQCFLRTPPGTTLGNQVCSSINRAERTATSAALSVGAIYRVASRQVIHPYVRGNIGLVWTQHSFLRTSGTVANGAVVEVYFDDKSTTVRPYLSLGGGVVTVIGRGFQGRFELRDNYIRIPAVSRATSQQNLKPPSTSVGKHLLSFIVAFDVVLERKRGRRY